MGGGGSTVVIGLGGLYLLRLEEVSNQWHEREAGLNRFNLCSYPEVCVLSVDWTSIGTEGMDCGQTGPGGLSQTVHSRREACSWRLQSYLHLSILKHLCSDRWSRMNSLCCPIW